jgi:hypothetical protein
LEGLATLGVADGGSLAACGGRTEIGEMGASALATPPAVIAIVKAITPRFMTVCRLALLHRSH